MIFRLQKMISSECEYSVQGMAFHGSVPLIMGTRLDVLLCGSSRELCMELWDEMCTEAERLDKLMNRFDPESEVSRLNASGRARVSDRLASILALCGRFRESTCGLFDIGRGTVAWDSLISDGMVDLNGGNLDFGGFGKGYLLKSFSSMLREAGVTSAYVDFGGSSIMTVGHHPFGNCWKVMVADPFTGEPIRQLELNDMSMSTSGNQPGYDGHIVDPRDGSPVCGRKIVTVLSPDPLTAEVVSTAAMIADGKELEHIRLNNEIASLLTFQS